MILKFRNVMRMSLWPIVISLLLAYDSFQRPTSLTMKIISISVFAYLLATYCSFQFMLKAIREGTVFITADTSNPVLAAVKGQVTNALRSYGVSVLSNRESGHRVFVRLTYNNTLEDRIGLFIKGRTNQFLDRVLLVGPMSLSTDIVTQLICKFLRDELEKGVEG